jgi:hypothetical protein
MSRACRRRIRAAYLDRAARARFALRYREVLGGMVRRRRAPAGAPRRARPGRAIAGRKD